MNESAKEQFRWKFWFVAVILNGVVFFFALGLIAVFLFPPAWQMPGAVICFVIALVLAVIFRKQYQKTRKWLEEKV